MSVDRRVSEGSHPSEKCPFTIATKFSVPVVYEVKVPPVTIEI